MLETEIMDMKDIGNHVEVDCSWGMSNCPGEKEGDGGQGTEPDLNDLKTDRRG